MFLSKLGKKNQQFPPTPTISLKAATSVCTDSYICEHRSGPCASVPKEAVPTNLLVQIYSVGPIPPAVAAATNAAAEPSAQKYLADGDQTLLNFSPLTTVTTREYQGLATIFLCPSGPDNQHFSSTGHLLDVTDAKPPLEPITLGQQGQLTFVTYTADFEPLERLNKYYALIFPSPVHMSQLCDNSANMDFTQLQAQTHVERHPPSDAVPQISPRDTSSKLYGDYYKLCSKAAYAQLSAAVLAASSPRRQSSPKVHLRHSFIPLFELEGQPS